jgi:hypothetical protein
MQGCTLALQLRRMRGQEGSVSRRTMGVLASVIGSAVGAWWWTRQRAAARARQIGPERGTVIFDNTPTAAEGPVL